MSESPLVSVVVAIYNIERFLPKCLASIQNQTYQHLELILVNDGSTDQSPTICEQAKQADRRIKVLHQKNGGLSNARNNGTAMATGKYLIYLDGDDYVAMDFIEKLVHRAEASQAEVVVCSYYDETVDESEHLLLRERIPFLAGNYGRTKFCEIPINNRNIGTLSYAWNKLYLLSFLRAQQLQFQEGLSVIEDITFNALVFQKIQKISFLDEPLIHYLHRPRRTLSSGSIDANTFALRSSVVTPIEQMLTDWQIDAQIVNELLGEIQLMNLKSLTIQLNQEIPEKKRRKELLQQELSKKGQIARIYTYAPPSLKEHLTKVLVLQKQSGLLLFLAKFRG